MTNFLVKSLAKILVKSLAKILVQEILVTIYRKYF